FSMLVHAHGFFIYKRMTPADCGWVRGLRYVITVQDEKLREVGRVNPGQKLLFWVMAATIALLLLSGIVIWQPWFAPWFSIGLNRVAVLIHALAAFVIIAGILVHIYAAYWVRGTIQGMTRGVVPRAWAKHHHPA